MVILLSKRVVSSAAIISELLVSINGFFLDLNKPVFAYAILLEESILNFLSVVEVNWVIVRLDLSLCLVAVLKHSCFYDILILLIKKEKKYKYKGQLLCIQSC